MLLFTYQQILKLPVTGTLNNIKYFRSREFYDIFKSQSIASNETMRINNFLALYCAVDKEIQAFFAKVVQEEEKKTSKKSLILNCYIVLCRAIRICLDGKLDHVVFVTYVRKHKLLNILLTFYAVRNSVAKQFQWSPFSGPDFLDYKASTFNTAFAFCTSKRGQLMFSQLIAFKLSMISFIIMQYMHYITTICQYKNHTILNIQYASETPSPPPPPAPQPQKNNDNNNNLYRMYSNINTCIIKCVGVYKNGV